MDQVLSKEFSNIWLKIKEMIDACILTIGDEILIGQIIDTNTAYISQTLNSIGVRITKKLSVGDDSEMIKAALDENVLNNDITIITGGLGPTKDDITKRTLSKYFQTDTFHYDEMQLSYIKEICARRGIEVSELNRDQALVPDNCRIINNSKGTAPGMLFSVKNKNSRNSLIFSLPGVPYEMEALLPEVCTIIKNSFLLENITHKTIITFGISESALAQKLDIWERALPQSVKLAYLPNPALGIKLRLSKYGGEREDSLKLITELSNDLCSLLGDLVYGGESDTLERVVGDILRKNKKTLSVAESCTGGRISALLTTNAGASDFFMGGAVVYSNDSKSHLIDVNAETIRKFGAVSRECAEEMAAGIRKRLGTDFSIAATGIAGPDGGSEEKPVGTIWIAVCGEDFTISKRSVMTGDRERNIIRFASEALNFFRLSLVERNISK